MAEKKPQSLANHARFVPLYHFVLALILLVHLGWSAWRLFRYPGTGSVWGVILALGFILLFYYCRAFPLAVQDRLIRLEERLRLLELLPEDLKSRVREISTDHLIGLRFASDEEVEDLVREILDGKLENRKAVKRRIRNWRPDYERC